MNVFVLVVCMIGFGMLSHAEEVSNGRKMESGNPIITHLRTADPSAEVWPDGKVWVYASHDMADAVKYRSMDGYHCFSSEDMVNWTDHGEILHSRNVTWGCPTGGFMFAPDAAYKNGKYYLYFPHMSRDWKWRVGVAISDKPEGPFVDIGVPIEGTDNIDPTCFIDDDGQAYLLWGGGYHPPKIAKLKENMFQLAEAPRVIEYGSDNFGEGAYLHKHKGIYYFSYTDQSMKGGWPYQSYYAMGDNPYGPFEFKGGLKKQAAGAQDHHSIIDYNGKSYYFYHVGNYNGGTMYRRNVCVDELHYNEDGTMQEVIATSNGVERVLQKTGQYAASWESLAKHQPAPEWLKDSKLGIYFHWGPYTVPAYASEWYPRLMNMPGHPVRTFHTETYGDPSEFGYHNLIPQFTGEHFDPENWAELFALAGAKFAGPVAEHHDGFAMWDSEVTPWNAKDMGPKRDILGELFQSLEKRGLKTIATFHHSRNLQRYRESWQEELKKQTGDPKTDFRIFANSHYPYVPGLFTASDDPQLRLLYGNVPEPEWLKNVWLAKLEEVEDKYRPDIIWFDSWLDQIPEKFRQRFCADYLNKADAWGKEVAIVRKNNDLPISFTVNDHEKSREPQALSSLWMTDDTISTGSWAYTRDLKVKPVRKIVHALVDTVSKNGIMLLNISPMADGTIPRDQRAALRVLGNWLKENGEAVYATRPWIVAAEGPTSEPGGGFDDREKFLALEYSPKDIRYTASKDGKTVFAITLGIPEPGSRILCSAFAGRAVRAVKLLNDKPVQWENTAAGLSITAPEAKGARYAQVYRITLNEPCVP